MWIWLKKHPVLAGVLCSVIYGTSLRLFFALSVNELKPYGVNLEEIFLTASVGFLFGAPLVMGYLTLAGHALKLPSEANAKISVMEALFLPWVPAGISFVAMLLFSLELAICLIMAGPIFLVMASIGGAIAKIVYDNGNGSYSRVLAGLLFLPMVGSGLEAQFPQPEAKYKVHNQILINADIDTVWKHIERVKTIKEKEQTHSYLHSFGFPRPLEATLSYEGVGGVRHASFEDNILFIETVTHWDKPHQLSFEIVPELSKTTSPIVNNKILGGKYFDVLEGTYTLEVQGKNTLLHLESKQKVSTFYNAYSSLWTRWIMSELQSYILRVVRQRCEAN